MPSISSQVSSRRLVLLLLTISMLLGTGAAQKGGGSTGGGRVTSKIPVPSDKPAQPIFISGRVALEGGQALPEPVAIERVCNGMARREGYSDFKGHFQLQVGGQSYGFQDASENDPRSTPTTTDRRIAQGGTCQLLTSQGCEIRAVLAGFQSSSVILRSSDCDEFQIDVGTIMLKRMGDAKGSAISATSMAAPKDARQAFEKGTRAFADDKLPQAEKELEKAVRIYPQFAAAWSRLGDVEHRQHNMDAARAAYNKALQADPQYVNPVFGLSLIAIAEKNWENAAQLTAKVAALNAYAFPAALFYNAAANYNLGKFDAAQESAKKYKSLDGEHHHPDISLLLSNILAMKRDFAGAAQEIREYLILVPDAPNAVELQAKAKSYEDMSLSKAQ
jgi:tetratricopeptide (TPR) repeat protein